MLPVAVVYFAREFYMLTVGYNQLGYGYGVTVFLRKYAVLVTVNSPGNKKGPREKTKAQLSPKIFLFIRPF